MNDGATRFRAWGGLALLSLLFFLVTAGSFTALGAVLPDMVAGLGWSWTGAGLGYTILGLACGLASFAPAVLIRRIGVRITLLLGGLVMAAGYASLAALHSLPLYWLGAGLIGVGYALAAVIPASYVITRTFTHASAAFGAYFTFGALGGTAGPLLYAGLKLFGADWRVYWIAAGGAVLLCSAATALVVQSGEGTDAPQIEDDSPVLDAPADFTVRAALATPQFWIVTFAYTTSLVCETSVNGLSIAHLIRQGVLPTAAAGMLSLQALLSAGARGAAGALGERIDAKRLTVGALVLMAVGIAALAMARGYPLMLTYAAGVGIGYGVSSLTALLLLIRYFGRKRNLELFSIMALISTLATGGPWLAGWMRDRFGGFEGAFALFAGLAVAALLALAWMKPPQTSAMADSNRP
jgi:MFS family permease